MTWIPSWHLRKVRILYAFSPNHHLKKMKNIFSWQRFMVFTLVRLESVVEGLVKGVTNKRDLVVDNGSVEAMNGKR